MSTLNSTNYTFSFLCWCICVSLPLLCFSEQIALVKLAFIIEAWRTLISSEINLSLTVSTLFTYFKLVRQMLDNGFLCLLSVIRILFYLISAMWCTVCPSYRYFFIEGSQIQIFCRKKWACTNVITGYGCWSSVLWGSVRLYNCTTPPFGHECASISAIIPSLADF